MTIPPKRVKSILDSGLGTVTRRIDIMESDGVTIWNKSAGNRLIDGSVNVSLGDNERRTADMTLRNDDNLLRSQPGGFWYDKILKVYRGVSYRGSAIPPTVAIIETQGGETSALRLAADISRAGLPGAKVLLTVPSYADLLEYDIIVSMTGTVASANPLLLQELYKAGKSIITVSVANGTAEIPHFTTTTAVAETIGIMQPSTTTSLSPGWTTEARGVGTGPFPTAISTGATSVARYQLANSSYVITGSIASNTNDGKWFDLHLPSLAATNTFILFTNGISWISGAGLTYNWETQIGEFCIDGISNDYFPSHVKVTGRDYVKKCTNSKVESALSFPPTTSLSVLVTALAANSGIKKLRLASMPETLDSTLAFDRGTPRWDIMVQAAQAKGYEIFFDNEGYLVTRKYFDPTLSKESVVFKTGVGGNLSTVSRAVNDSRIYNHICVYGDPASGEERMPYFAEAKNITSSSPTSIAKIGDRYYSYATTFFSSQAQCQEFAQRLLALHALESFELSFTSINYPWLEVGEIAKVIDPKAVATDPVKYLIDSLTIPLGLGPMSLTGKRITIVG